MVTQEVIAAVEAAVAQYERAIFEIENIEASVVQIILWLSKKNMEQGLCMFFRGNDYYEYIADILNLPVSKHLFATPDAYYTKKGVLEALRCRSNYMKKHLAEWQDKIIVKQEASLF